MGGVLLLYSTSKKHLKEKIMISNHKIPIMEIFKSIDGEAFHSGQATVFVRTFQCNLRCVYCDTKSCWNLKEYEKVYHKEPQMMTAKEILDKVEELEKDFKYKSICLTGGEPLLEENQDFIIEQLIPLFLEKNYAVNIETNGAVDYKRIKDTFGNPEILDSYGNRKGVTLITDWKLYSSKMSRKMIENNLKILSEYDLIKCVISDKEEDWVGFERICKSGTKAKIYLSPMFGEVTMHRIPEFVFNHPQYDITCQLQQHKFFWDPNQVSV